MNESFYIGYHPKAPRSLARAISAISALLLTMTVVVSLLLVRSQDAFYPSRFEFGTTRAYEGWYQSRPVPTLTLASPDTSTLPISFLLVAEGKHGAETKLASLEDGPVRLEGTLIQRDHARMLEVVSGSVKASSPVASLHALESLRLGAVSLRGEIVDSKCFLGVMNPGEKTVHRACATLCIRGGTPPMLILRRPGHASEYLLLTGGHGEPINQDILPFVARPVVVEGILYRYGNIFELQADPTNIKILP